VPRIQKPENNSSKLSTVNFSEGHSYVRNGKRWIEAESHGRFSNHLQMLRIHACVDYFLLLGTKKKLLIDRSRTIVLAKQLKYRSRTTPLLQQRSKNLPRHMKKMHFLMITAKLTVRSVTRTTHPLVSGSSTLLI
jgi:hypothetical protein